MLQQITTICNNFAETNHLTIIPKDEEVGQTRVVNFFFLKDDDVLFTVNYSRWRDDITLEVWSSVQMTSDDGTRVSLSSLEDCLKLLFNISRI